MAEFRRHFAPDGRWRFLTAPSEAEIAPVLGDYGQDVRPPLGDEQEAGGRLSHVLKVFLVDGDRRVRNIYSAGFLDVRILLHDAATVLGVY